MPENKICLSSPYGRGQVQRSAKLPAKDTDENQALLLVKMLLGQSPLKAYEVS